LYFFSPQILCSLSASSTISYLPALLPLSNSAPNRFTQSTLHPIPSMPFPRRCLSGHHPSNARLPSFAVQPIKSSTPTLWFHTANANDLAPIISAFLSYSDLDIASPASFIFPSISLAIPLLPAPRYDSLCLSLRFLYNSFLLSNSPLPCLYHPLRL
jgi:hypothetical protein